MKGTHRPRSTRYIVELAYLADVGALERPREVTREIVVYATSDADLASKVARSMGAIAPAMGYRFSPRVAGHVTHTGELVIEDPVRMSGELAAE